MDQTVLWMLVFGIILLLMAGGGLYISVLVKNVLEEIRTSQERTRDALPNIFNENSGEQIARGLSPAIEQMTQLSGTIENLLIQLTRGLDKSNAQFQQATQQMSHSADEIEQLRGALNDSHSQFQGAMMTLAEPGSLQQWVQRLQLALQPLEKVQASLDEHYQINGHLMQTTGTLLTEWSGQRHTVAESSQKIADSLAEWAGGEIARRAEFERHIRQYLEESGKQSALMASNLGALQTEVHRVASSTEDLKVTTQSAINAIGRQVDLQKLIGVDQENVVNGLGRMSTELAERQAELGQELERVVKDVGTMGRKTQAWEVKRQQQVKAQLEEISEAFQSTISNFHTDHKKVLKELQEQNRSFVENQEEVLQKVHDLPTATSQEQQTNLLKYLLVAQILTPILITIIAGLIFYALSSS